MCSPGTGSAAGRRSCFGGRVGLFHNQPADRLLDTADVVVAIGYNPVEYEPGPWNRVRVEHRVIVADRPGARHILEILDEVGCDLVVMGTHGHSWLKHRLSGSLTEEVVRVARCPVLVVKAPASAQVPAAPEPAQTTGA